MMGRKNRLLLPSVLCVLLSGCAGLTFDDIFNPSLPQDGSTRGKTQPSTREDQTTALPDRSETPANTVNSSKRADAAVHCLSQELEKRFNLPDNFYSIKKYPGGAATVQLVNPYTKRQGLFIDVEPRNSGSRLRLYANYTTMSTAWRTLPEKCR